MRLFDERYSIEGMAVQLRREASRGMHRGYGTLADRTYLKNCEAVHSSSWTHVIFDREEGVYDYLKFRTFSRCLTLLLTFVNPATREKVPMAHLDWVRVHPWVVALFGQDWEAAWLENPAMGHVTLSLHLWCDESWKPIWVPNQEQVEVLTSHRWRPYEFPQKSTCIEERTAVESK